MKQARVVNLESRDRSLLTANRRHARSINLQFMLREKEIKTGRFRSPDLGRNTSCKEITLYSCSKSLLCEFVKSLIFVLENDSKNPQTASNMFNNE